ncbi:MAG: hypothetical protein EKK34_00950 [Mycobacterium sp.]|nr:MAG: hypothetical protein EKK34_00950 [Mycobacterium sp.]
MSRGIFGGSELTVGFCALLEVGGRLGGLLRQLRWLSLLGGYLLGRRLLGGGLLGRCFGRGGLLRRSLLGGRLRGACLLGGGLLGRRIRLRLAVRSILRVCHAAAPLQLGRR